MRSRSKSFILLLVFFLSVCADVQSFSPTRQAPIGHAAILHGAPEDSSSEQQRILKIPRGGSIIPAGWNPFGYKVTKLGHEFLGFGDSLSSDVGRFLASLKAHRKRRKAIKEQWLEIVRASKKGQNMRIYRELDNLLDFCLRAGLIN